MLPTLAFLNPESQGNLTGPEGLKGLRIKYVLPMLRTVLRSVLRCSALSLSPAVEHVDATSTVAAEGKL